MGQERYESREVEQARERVAEDVRNVAYNANVAERTEEIAQNKVGDARQAVIKGVRNVTVENPMGMLLAGMAVGFLVGMMLPVTRFESERIGPMAEGLKDRAREAGSEVMRRGGEVIKDTIEGSKEAATASIRMQTADMMPDDASSMT